MSKIRKDFMELLDFIIKYWILFAVIGGVITTFATLKYAIKEVKRAQESSTELLSSKIDNKFSELRGDVEVISVRVDNLCKSVDKQNGRIERSENWQREHVEHYHTK